jgi:hypothetical protein
MFGDTVSYIDGGISFEVVDVVAPTNVKLPLQFGRRWRPFEQSYIDTANQASDAKFQILGPRWKPDIPYISGVYPKRDGLYTGSRARCTGGSLVPHSFPVVGRPPVMTYNFWYGVQVNIPGYGNEAMWPTAPSSPMPATGVIYKFSTKSEWRIACLPSLQNGTGEGYVATLPDGARYEFNWLALRPVTPAPVSFMNEPRVEMFFMATRAVDKFGNTVNYEYDPDFPSHLTRMVASDGAEIRFTYSTEGQLSTVTTGGRTWQYKYTPLSGRAQLTQVVLPDSTKWQLSQLQYFGGHPLNPIFGQSCNFSPGPYTSTGDSMRASTTMVHPSGASAEFVFKEIALGYNNVPYGGCNTAQPPQFPQGRVKAFITWPLVSKKITGPGIEPRTSTITYAPSWSYATECGSGCPSTSTTTVADGDGTVNTFVFGNDAQVNANQLLIHTMSKAGTVFRRTEYTYMTDITGQPFRKWITGPDDETPDGTLENHFFRLHRPQVQQAIYQEGRIFKSVVNTFDVFARPTSVTKSSAPAP